MSFSVGPSVEQRRRSALLYNGASPSGKNEWGNRSATRLLRYVSMWSSNATVFVTHHHIDLRTASEWNLEGWQITTSNQLDLRALMTTMRCIHVAARTGCKKRFPEHCFLLDSITFTQSLNDQLRLRYYSNLSSRLATRRQVIGKTL